MDYFIFIIGNIIFLYAVLVIFLIYGFYNVPEITYQNNESRNKFTVVVAFRNEENNLEKLVASLAVIEYPVDKFEVIFVDDHSTDSSYDLLKTLLRYTKLDSKILKLEEAHTGKKRAISLAVSNASNPWIITTDADCEVPKMWLRSFDQKLQEEPETLFVAAPINLDLKGEDFFTIFQKYDLAAMMGATVGGFGLGRPFLCNGANMLYNKNQFFKLGGYRSNYQISSGDDLFLMDLFYREDPSSVSFLKSRGAIVVTNGETNFDSFLNQRVRWAAKSTSYKSFFLNFISMYVGFANLIVLIMSLTLLITLNLNLLFFFLLKLLVDFWLIKVSDNMLGMRLKLNFYWAIAFVYPVYVTVIGALSQLRDFEWKGRRIAK